MAVVKVFRSNRGQVVESYIYLEITDFHGCPARNSPRQVNFPQNYCCRRISLSPRERMPTFGKVLSYASWVMEERDWRTHTRDGPGSGPSRVCSTGTSRDHSPMSWLDDEMASPVLLITGFGAIFTERALFAVGHDAEAVLPNPKIH
jgi:hypothetical protein